MNQTTVFASGCVKYWGKGIQTFNSAVDKLNDEWTAAVADDFGLTKPTRPGTSGRPMAGNVRVLESYNADLASFNTELSAKKAAKAKELRGRFTKLETKLDDLAQKIAGMLRKGPGEKSILTLFGAGALPIESIMVFPKADWSKADYEKFWRQLDDGSPLSIFLTTGSREDVAKWLKEHPGITKAVEWLLEENGVKPTALQLSLVKAQAHLDALTLKDGIDGPAGSDALEKIKDATARLRLINGTARGDGRINAASVAFVDTWMNDVGAKDLGKLSDVVRDSVREAGAPPYGVDAEVKSHLQPIGNSIMIRSNPDQAEATTDPTTGRALYVTDLNGDGRTDLSDMPDAVQDLVGTRIGESSSSGRYPSLDEGPYGNHPSFDIKGIDQFNGFADLMDASTVEGGDDFTVSLAESAIRAKQDMNAIVATVEETGLGNAQEVAELRSRLDDDSASDLLSVVGRNEDASAQVLVDDDLRPTLLGMNWNDGDGAADVIHAGTDRNPDEGGGTVLQAQAAYEVMKEIADDQGEYQKRIQSEVVSDAIVDVGVTWVDTFAEKPGEHAPGTYENWQDPLGRPVDLGITLSDADRQSFLEFVSGSDDRDATRFHAAATAYTNELVDTAIESGKPDKIGDATYAAGLLEGNIKRADVEFFKDTAEDTEDRRQAAYEAEVRSQNAQTAALKFATSAGATVGGAVFPPAAPFLAVGAAAADPFINDLIDDAGEPPPAKSEEQTEELERRVDQLSEQTSSRLIEPRRELSALEREVFQNTWDRAYDNAYDKRGGDNDQRAGWAEAEQARRRLYGEAGAATFPRYGGGDDRLPHNPGKLP